MAIQSVLETGAASAPKEQPKGEAQPNKETPAGSGAAPTKLVSVALKFEDSRGHEWPIQDGKLVDTRYTTFLTPRDFDAAVAEFAAKNTSSDDAKDKKVDGEKKADDAEKSEEGWIMWMFCAPVRNTYNAGAYVLSSAWSATKAVGNAFLYLVTLRFIFGGSEATEEATTNENKEAAADTAENADSASEAKKAETPKEEGTGTGE